MNKTLKEVRERAMYISDIGHCARVGRIIGLMLGVAEVPVWLD